MQGYNGSQLWDTAFTAQAVAATALLSDTTRRTLTRAHAYVKNTQARPLPLCPLLLLRCQFRHVCCHPLCAHGAFIAASI